MEKTQGLQADPIKLGQRLGEQVQLYCPLFQRSYVWGQTQINRLWEDIDTVLDGQYPSRFLGALVFDDDLGPTASRAGQYWVIDGQQRLTTAYLTIVALAIVARRCGDNGDVIARDLYSQFLVSQKSDTRDVPRLRPTVHDTAQFNSILKSAFEDDGVVLDLGGQSGDSTGNMTKSFDIILKKIEARTLFDETGMKLGVDDVIPRVEKLRDVLLDQLEFVEIRLGDVHDANEVFDRLNNEGLRLGLIDLVRNEVLKRLKDDAATALQIYYSEWQSFEDRFPNEPAKQNYFFPFALTVDPSITKASTFKRLTRHWRDIAGLGHTPKQQLKSIMADLSRHQSSYNAIDSSDFEAFDPELQPVIRRLNDLNRPSTLYPYVLQLLTGTIDGDVPIDAARSCLEVIEAFLVRRAFLGIEPTGLHAVFKKLWNDAGWDVGAVRRSIVSRTVVYPTDAQFSAAVVSGNLYQRRIAKFVLAEYERDRWTLDMMKSLPEITIDHVMPQKYNESWAVDFSPEQHAQWVNTWANLVPLSGPANSSKQGGSWLESRRLLQTETMFKTTKDIYTKNELWTPGVLEQRAAYLNDWALRKWPSYESLLVDPSTQTMPMLGD